MDYEDKQIFYVSSENRISGTSSSFLYKFDIDGNNYDHAVILAASIPKSYYLVTSENDEFYLTEGVDVVDIQLPVGNYTLTSWRNTLTTVLNATSPHGWIYNISFPATTEPNTGKLTFTVSGNGLSQPQFTFSEYLYEQMGFNPGTYTFSNNTLISTNVISLQLLNAVFISSDLCNNKHDNVLQEVYSNNSDFSFISYHAHCPDAYGKKLTTRGNNVYNFYLINKYGSRIDLNGLNWNFTLMFYKKNNTLDLIRDYIRFTLIKNGE